VWLENKRQIKGSTHTNTNKCVSAFIFTKLSTKTLCFDAAVFHLTIKGYCKTRPRCSYCFLSMFKLHCKRHNI